MTLEIIQKRLEKNTVHLDKSAYDGIVDPVC